MCFLLNFSTAPLNWINSVPPTYATDEPLLVGAGGHRNPNQLNVCMELKHEWSIIIISLGGGSEQPQPQVVAATWKSREGTPSQIRFFRFIYLLLYLNCPAELTHRHSLHLSQMLYVRQITPWITFNIILFADDLWLDWVIVCVHYRLDGFNICVHRVSLVAAHPPPTPPPL